MTITKRIYDFQPGTYINGRNGDYVITSEYDSFHGWYECSKIEFNDNDEAIEVPGSHVTPSDMIGDEYFPQY